VIGTLKVSKGSVEWRPTNAKLGHHLSWVDFGALMEAHGKK
jgi:hypothetical protein